KWLWDAIDKKTRYVVATHISTGRDVGQAVKFMLETKRRNERPHIIVTDGLQSYNGAIKKVYWSNRLDRRVAHDRSPGLKAGNKNRIERFHSTLKGRYNGMRGLKNPETGHVLLKGFIIQYNYLRPHEALDDLTPAEASGIKLPFEDGWANLIDWATIHQTRRKWPPVETDETSDN
ncbi:MAG TPA: DDE-type integrase/transposase/recombinase, partial [Thermoplasmata archaeon]|nr:DDE-type integrase/transposase/recombinase [Thermoplasmata archaeon]